MADTLTNSHVRPTARTVDWRRWLDVLVRNALLVGLIALVAYFAATTPRFLTVSNSSVVLVQISYVAVVAVPLAMLLIAGRLDLSVGSVLALGGVTAGLLLTDGSSLWIAVLAGVGVGAAAGLVNGVLVGALGLSTIIVTLGALTAVRGLVLVISPGPLVNLGDGMRELGSGELAGVPYLVIIAAAVLLAGAAVLTVTPVGRHIYAIGVNEEAARLSGIRVTAITIGLFVATGAAAGLAGVMLAARLGSAPSGVMGVGFELDVLTAILLGGVAFTGGVGTMRGVLMGLLFLAVLKNGLILENVPSALGSMLTGCVLIAAAFLDRFANREPRRRRTESVTDPADPRAGSGGPGEPAVAGDEVRETPVVSQAGPGKGGSR